MQRSPTVLAAAAAGVLVIAHPASAAGSPRLVDPYVVQYTVQRGATDGHSTGTVYAEFPDFTPQCRTGGCPTVWSYQDYSGTKVSAKLTPEDLTYSGKTTWLLPCYTEHGAVKERYAYSGTETFTLTATKVVKGKVVRFTGVDTQDYVRTAKGTRAGCHPGGHVSYKTAAEPCTYCELATPVGDRLH